MGIIWASRGQPVSHYLNPSLRLTHTLPTPTHALITLPLTTCPRLPMPSSRYPIPTPPQYALLTPLHSLSLRQPTPPHSL
ncbi:hypothetical protein Pmani_024440 [Petrolisthes manimaculis]|uniref:Uncharacterized protein n=1 Tax=Petrolisthes manimaculis TaxID=1843537 RepID=A0AAE1TZC7_9EUCA|nr:hypothetical protein Pmani_024440 [Petrolisthes manimaculis]